MIVSLIYHFECSVILLRSDIHEVPAISTHSKHFHYDVRFLLEADPRKNNIIVSEESHDVQWIPLNEVLDMNPESSMHRMVNKTYSLAR
mgnify:CR=1 FL=1